MLTAGETAQMMKTEESVVYQLAESGKLQFGATSEGMLLICPDSLVALQSDEHSRPSHEILTTEGEVLAD